MHLIYILTLCTLLRLLVANPRRTRNVFSVFRSGLVPTMALTVARRSAGRSGKYVTLLSKDLEMLDILDPAREIDPRSRLHAPTRMVLLPSPDLTCQIRDSGFVGARVQPCLNWCAKFWLSCVRDVCISISYVPKKYRCVLFPSVLIPGCCWITT